MHRHRYPILRLHKSARRILSAGAVGVASAQELLFLHVRLVARSLLSLPLRCDQQSTLPKP